jgi:hypothetical protein
LKIAGTTLKKGLKLFAIALPPLGRIEAREQVSEAGIHKSSGLFARAFAPEMRVGPSFSIPLAAGIMPVYPV